VQAASLKMQLELLKPTDTKVIHELEREVSVSSQSSSTTQNRSRLPDS
jgi:hypothetical protein